MNRRTAATRAAVAAGAAGAAYGALQWLGRAYGSTRAERHSALPGDELCPDPQVITTHAITIDAPPAAVWPWLVRMGWDRGQRYTARRVDRLVVPADGPSADRTVDDLRKLAVGDRILDGPPELEGAFTVRRIEPDHHLVLHSTDRLPPGWARRFRASVDFTWAFVLEDVGAGCTRFLFRSRIRVAPGRVRALYLATAVPADFVMSRQMLRGVKARAEGTGENLPPTEDATPTDRAAEATVDLTVTVPPMPVSHG